MSKYNYHFFKQTFFFLCFLIVGKVVDAQNKPISQNLDSKNLGSCVISSSFGPNGSINPSGEIPKLSVGNAKNFIITPNLGYMIDALKVDDVAVNPTNEYLITVTKPKHTISCTFKPSKVALYGAIKLYNAEGVIGLAGGTNHILGFKADGSVIIVGGGKKYGDYIPAGLKDVVALDVFDHHVVALKKDGKVVTWHLDNKQSEYPDDLVNITAVATGHSFTIALKDEGTIVVWDFSGEKLSIPVNLKGVIGISTGGNNIIALMHDGFVKEWDVKAPQNVKNFEGLNNVVAISGGSNHTLALRSDGSLVEWLRNVEFQPTIPPKIDDIVSVAAGPCHNVVLKKDGTIVTWPNQLNHNTTLIEVDIPKELPPVKTIATGGKTTALLFK